MSNKKPITKKIIEVKKSSVNEDYNEDDNSFTETEKVDKKNDNDAKQYIKSDFLEKLVKYVKTDNLIRKETVEFREKINTLKEDKEELETYILRYLDNVNQDFVELSGSGKLTKYESVRKSSINQDIIKQSIVDQIKKEKLMADENEIKKLAESTYEIMEGKREKKVKTVLKRTFTKGAKKGAGEKDEKKKANKKQNEKQDDNKPKKVGRKKKDE